MKQLKHLCQQRTGHERGVVLIVVLVMLVIIGFMSVSVMRGAVEADQMSNSNRAQNQASEAAQLALRYCETAILTADPTLTIRAAPANNDTPMLWLTKANWVGDQALALEVPAAALKPTGMGSTLKRPQCLAQFGPLAIAAAGAGVGNTDQVILTVRGFSADYTQDSTSNTLQSGSVVWLQSTILRTAGVSP
jgi:type IV pilus assembly protein PilX